MALDQLRAARELVLPHRAQWPAVGAKSTAATEPDPVSECASCDGAEGCRYEHPFNPEVTVTREHSGGEQCGLAGDREACPCEQHHDEQRDVCSGEGFDGRTHCVAIWGSTDGATRRCVMLNPPRACRGSRLRSRRAGAGVPLGK